MKSERRHELEHNALADWMTDLVATLKPYANYLLVGILAVVLATIAYNMWSRGADARQTAAWDTMLNSVLTGKPGEMERTADDFPDSEVGFMARTIAGDVRLSQGCSLVFESKAKADPELEKAIDQYGKVVKKCRIPEIVARAQYGLGRAYETKGELAKAKEAYEAASKADPDGVYAGLSRDRFDDLDRSETKGFYERFALYKPSANSPVKDAPGTAGSRPEFSLESLRELPRSSSSTGGLTLPSGMKIQGEPAEEKTPAAETPKEEAAPKDDGEKADKKADAKPAESDPAK